LTYKLVHLVQYHADHLAASLVRRAEMSERTESYRHVSTVELKERVYEIYHHLGTWLVDNSETDIEQRYMTIGSRRAEQDVPLSELVWVIVLTKRNLLEYINDLSFPGPTVEASEKQELSQRLERFFDEAIHAAVVGYECAAQKRTCANEATAEIRVRNITRKVS
jgi:hypothetical protein